LPSSHQRTKNIKFITFDFLLFKQVKDMKEIIKKIKAILHLGRKTSSKHRQKSRAQSMVEFALLLPILLVLFLGMVEFGFMLNTYLSLLDATREAARAYSNSVPFELNGTVVQDDMDFYEACADLVETSLAQHSPLDSAYDDVLVSVLAVEVNEATNPDTIASITRYPDSMNNFSLWGNYPTSAYDDTKVTNYMTNFGAEPVNAGLLIVEVYYSYEGTLQIATPLITMFGPGERVMLYASTIMPLVSVRPY
jgi:Flp pilus assembly protein TadG